MALYGFILLMAALAYYILERMRIAHQGSGSILSKSLGSDIKRKASPILYIIAIFFTFIRQ